MAQHPPAVHPKNVPTGKGVQPKTPGNSNLGNSMHRPTTGRDYQTQQQQPVQDAGGA